MKVDHTELNWNLLIALLAEFSGCLLLMSLGCLGCLSTTSFPKGHIDIAVNFGLIMTVCVYIFAPLSGGFVNPYVSTAACILGHIKWDKCLMYIVVQMLGGLVGYSLLACMIPENYFDHDLGLCYAKPKEALLDWRIMMAEFMGTGVFLFVWAANLDERSATYREALALRIGFVNLGITACVGYFTGNSMNLARSIPPAVFHGGWEDIWQETTAQIAATIVIPLVWRFVFAKPYNKQEEEEEAN